MRVARFEFNLKTLNSFGLPDFKGSTFRGKFGHVLKRTVCVISHRNCEICELRERCAYPYLFETQNTKNEDVPRPFIIEPPLTHKRFFLKEERMYMNIILLGKAIEYLPYFIYTFDRMGREGIGQDRGRYLLEEVKSVGSDGSRAVIYSADAQELHNQFETIELDEFTSGLIPQISLQFLTPVQIKAAGKPVIELEFSVLLKAILRRYHSLRYFHGDGSKERFDINWDEAERVETLHSDLKPERFKRYSNRQNRSIPMGGLTGSITYRGNLGQFYPWLKIGEYLHVGKGATFGMGWYRVVGG